MKKILLKEDQVNEDNSEVEEPEENGPETSENPVVVEPEEPVVEKQTKRTWKQVLL